MQREIDRWKRMGPPGRMRASMRTRILMSSCKSPGLATLPRQRKGNSSPRHHHSPPTQEAATVVTALIGLRRRNAGNPSTRPWRGFRAAAKQDSEISYSPAAHRYELPRSWRAVGVASGQGTMAHDGPGLEEPNIDARAKGKTPIGKAPMCLLDLPDPQTQGSTVWGPSPSIRKPLFARRGTELLLTRVLVRTLIHDPASSMLTTDSSAFHFHLTSCSVTT